MKKVIILPGDFYKNLKVIEEIPKDGKFRKFKTECIKCGAINNKYMCTLLHAKTGCSCTNSGWRNKQSVEEKKMRRLYEKIICRCNRHTGRNTKYYVEKGVKCEWHSFEEFYSDMGNKPSPSHSIDRIDSNGNYSKENCRWADIYTQNNNRCNNIIIEGLPLAVWCRKKGAFSFYHKAFRYIKRGESLDYINNRLVKYLSDKS